ncbi:hypothetical protein COA08_16540 [Bacillus cereus]|uniref:Uncharacterized protein n=1 Tax=Bacillus cereus TaxID=1396 RepID=A0A2B1D4Y5_BACCE|nr:hypothetical protein CON06_17180 [Bacillus cereus]PFA08188.1 hypothetical protein CN382_24380 [Bacillus cereus]PFM33051.1 hypothetical protein COJ43_27020 [Bacillus cereus]PGL62133.1 hypothetical protein CN927_10780 [Bacillus cereus]PGQ08127.1 hypothetical protein COA08_16540 [Bacillus cereus]
MRAGNAARLGKVKVKAARSESQVIGTLDREALLAQAESVKWPEILAAVAR